MAEIQYIIFSFLFNFNPNRIELDASLYKGAIQNWTAAITLDRAVIDGGLGHSGCPIWPDTVVRALSVVDFLIDQSGTRWIRGRTRFCALEPD